MDKHARFVAMRLVLQWMESFLWPVMSVHSQSTGPAMSMNVVKAIRSAGLDAKPDLRDTKVRVCFPLISISQYS